MTRDDEVFALGSNGAGCLGQGDMHSSLQPKQVEPLCYKVLNEHACWAGEGGGGGKVFVFACSNN